MFVACKGVPKCGPTIGRPIVVRSQSFHTNRVIQEEIKTQYRPPRPVIPVKPQDPKKLKAIRLTNSMDLLRKHLREVDAVDKAKWEEEQRIKHEEWKRQREIRKVEKKKAKAAIREQMEKRLAIEREQRALEKSERIERYKTESKIKQESKKEFLEALMEDIPQWEYHPREMVYKRYEFTGELPKQMQSWMTNNTRPSLEKYKTDN
mmetsp:Transcript_6447/g.8961  ORF Transcript_6447/g.8961 Transcript_6447/m.8961 type:complete len:206 (+) Transcript_6447:41-658(+)